VGEDVHAEELADRGLLEVGASAVRLPVGHGRHGALTGGGLFHGKGSNENVVRRRYALNSARAGPWKGRPGGTAKAQRGPRGPSERVGAVLAHGTRRLGAPSPREKSIPPGPPAFVGQRATPLRQGTGCVIAWVRGQTVGGIGLRVG